MMIGSAQSIVTRSMAGRNTINNANEEIFHTGIWEPEDTTHGNEGTNL